MRALPLVVLLAAATRVDAAPRIALGEPRFTHGRYVTHISVCDKGRVVSAEAGPWVRSWQLPDGTPGKAFGPYEGLETTAVACAGALTVIARNERAELWRGDKLVASTKIKWGVAATVVGNKAYVLDEDALHELSEQGTKVLWKPTSLGLYAVVRPDLVVSISDTSLVWSTPGKTDTLTFPEPLAAIADLGNAIAVVSKTGVVRVLDKPHVPAPAFAFDVEKIGTPRSIGGDARWIGVGTSEGNLVQATRAGKVQPPVEIIAPDMSTSVLAVRVAGEHWLVGGDDQRVRRVPLGAKSYTRPEVAGHTDLVWSIALDDNWVASASSDETVRVHALDGKLVRTFDPRSELGSRPMLEVGLTPSILWALDDYANLYRWKRAGLTPMKQIGRIEQAVALGGNRLAVWHKQALATLDLASGAIKPVGVPLKITEPELAAGGDIVVVQDELHEEKPLYVIDVTAGTKIAEIPRVDEPTVWKFAVSPDGSQIAIAEDEVLRVWSRKTKKAVEVGRLHAPIDALAWSADGRIAAGDWTGRVNVWKPGTAKPIAELTDHMGPIYSLAWRGKSLASGGGDLRVLVTDIPD